MNAMHKPSAMLGILLLLSGCGTVTADRDATLALIRHPQFPSAAKAAPGWVDAALRTITEYEAELFTRK